MATALQIIIAHLRADGIETDEEKATRMLANMGKTPEEYLQVLDEAKAWADNYKHGTPPADGQADKYLEPISYTLEEGK